jgi:hypothetical protein
VEVAVDLIVAYVGDAVWAKTCVMLSFALISLISIT